LYRLGAGCHTPVAGFARLDGPALSVAGFVASGDGHTVLAAAVRGAPRGARGLGEKLAEELLARGAGALLIADGTSREGERWVRAEGVGTGRPLADSVVVVTRAAPQAGALRDALEADGSRVV